MRFIRLQSVALVLGLIFALGFTLETAQQTAYGQETTGGIQGTVKDPSGAVVAGATVTVTTPTLVGSKVVQTDAAGYYRFANLPPGKYTVTVKAQGFDTLKHENVVLEVGHLPTLDMTLKVGAVDTVVEVTTQGPMIDETTTTTLTNIPQEALSDIPHGVSFQSVIQFAPEARNEPLEGSSMLSNGSGSTSPGNGSNGGAFGYSIGGGADSENSYLVEGQETANIIGGYSHTNVPMDFIQEVQMKTSGVEAEYGGALGGVVNVIMEKGTNHWHGSIFTSFQDGAMNGSPLAESRYDPSSSGTSTDWGAIDPTYQNYQPIRPKTSDVFPGVTLGGPIAELFPKLYGVPDAAYEKLKERLFLFVGFNPEFNAYEETLNYGPNGGKIPFSQNTHTFYGNARLDAEITDKIRVFGSWLSQGQKQYGESLPTADSVQGYFNTVTGCETISGSLTCNGNYVDPSTYAHTLGYSAPNLTLNTGADITLTNTLVSTTRFGYYFENYHDFGYPTSGAIDLWEANGGSPNTDTNGDPLPASLAQATGYLNQALDGNFTHLNSNKAIQFDQDIAWFHAGTGGTHNLKFGYQLHRNSNYIFQGYNAPLVEVYPGITNPYSPQGTVGEDNCATVEADTGDTEDGCVGTYGTINVNDFGSGGKATGFNHGFYVQDAWTVGKGLTINAGIRIEREYLPAENQPANATITKPINFGWGDKVAPRIGAAWDVFKNGKMKISGAYGEFYDQMKLNVAISSYGGQYWQECWYALMTSDLSGVLPVLNSNNRYCVGPNSSSEANWGGTTPSGLIFLENQNLRAFPTTCSTCSSTAEGTAPGLKPYAQHDSAVGVDYQLASNVTVSAHWDRRRLDHVIEDSAIYNPDIGETFVIVNPGQGVNSTFTGFYNFLYGTAPDCSDGCPPNKTIPAARSYDGIEFRVSKNVSHNWMGMFSYTYSKFRGNYTGLTSSDVADGGGGRNAPNNSRAFDEPFFSWNAFGGSSSGLLPTDRPNALKGYVYYILPWARKFATTFGVFQSAYSGTPLTSYLDVGYAFPSGFPTDIVDRGKWIDVSQDPTTGLITASAPYTKRTSWFTDTDFNFKQSVKLHESKELSFDATFSNLLNEHAAVSYGQQIDSGYATNFIAPGGQWIIDGPSFYAAAMTPYDYVGAMNAAFSNGGNPLTINSQYGKPYLYQVPRNIRLGLHITF
ncbi:MAG TPA: carboxypeptidase regulatory-like domain-containing protein [Terracidiphilus sp.]|nr:carboxypeptidase regulatory-like domain-containing protein [Terracidiphilus sp.]